MTPRLTRAPADLPAPRVSVDTCAETIWRSVVTNIVDVWPRPTCAATQIAAIGYHQTSARPSWPGDAATHQTVANAIVWQCRRTTDFCTITQRARGPADQTAHGALDRPVLLRQQNAGSSRNTPGLRRRAAAGAVKFGTNDRSFMMWRLTGGAVHKTDVSKRLAHAADEFAHDALGPRSSQKFSGCPRRAMPEIVESNAEFGTTKNIPGLPDGIPIRGHRRRSAVGALRVKVLRGRDGEMFIRHRIVLDDEHRSPPGVTSRYRSLRRRPGSCAAKSRPTPSGRRLYLRRGRAVVCATKWGLSKTAPRSKPGVRGRVRPKACI